MKIRRAFAEDAADLAKLFERAYSTSMAPAYEEAAFAAALPFLTRSNPELLGSGTYYVVELEEPGTILGAGGWTRECPGTKEITSGLAHLRHFATDPCIARQGVGRRIFRECARDAEKAGAGLFQAFSSLNAVAFYEGLGLVVVRRMDLQFSPSVSLPAILMQGPVSMG